MGEALTHLGSSSSVCLPAFEELILHADILHVHDDDNPIPAVGQSVASLFEGIASGHGSLPALHTVRIVGNDRTDIAVACSVATCILKSKLPQLRDLHFCSPLLLTREGMQTFATALCSHTVKTLRSLTLEKAETEDTPEDRTAEVDQMQEIAAALSFGQLTGLQELSLVGPLFSQGLSALTVGLASGKLPSLRLLELPEYPWEMVKRRPLSAKLSLQRNCHNYDI
uniref:Uncharacterized protein n=1 Tax=Chromera velia CCMP2878 TaxID=1169474 RepID=A0A0G4I285_9ALVE|eukprot:Cvel_10329.t1-p1 / transcript=Cvel_10329.t1 / gene=Cvel_10329 / organism=Chromera_velia_CCMP2878 / gene_product=hypothetical protein / transcript_product=hypothetical protein / location=Cvel_scaffold620:42126-42800(+) / protein_length=225 / sequence_SO=supercontig / SO=protein_coding / is_pseudo=false